MIGINGWTIARLAWKCRQPAPLRIPTRPMGREFHKPVVYQIAADHHASIENRHVVDGRYALDAQNHVRFDWGPMTTAGRWSLTRFSFTPLTWAAAGATSVTPSRLTPSLDCLHRGRHKLLRLPLTTRPVSPLISANQRERRRLRDGNQFRRNALIYSTYLGGSRTDTATALAVSNGSCFITGYTDSADFPTIAPTGIGTTTPFQADLRRQY